MNTLILMLFLCAEPVAMGTFETHFLDKTMRLDYYHLGKADQDEIAFDRIVSDGPWPGSKTHLVERQVFGKYRCQVLDEGGTTVLFSYGFSSIFGEWQTTAEADQAWGSFHESLRFPWPKQKVTVVLEKRGPNNAFVPFWRKLVDPLERQINPADVTPSYKVHKLVDNGPAEKKVDLLFLGDGYTAAQMGKFVADTQRLVGNLFAVEPYKSRQADFNVYAIETPSQESGVSRPHASLYKRSALGSSYSTFDSERYILNLENRKLRDIAAAVPYDYMVILVNDKVYGGGGIYRWQATLAADNKVSDYLLVHEFGHHFADLADEYYTSSVAYQVDDKISSEPWEPNLTALLDPAELKWRDLIVDGTPLPTPWEKDVFEKFSMAVQTKRAQLRAAQADESEMDALFLEQKTFETQLFAKMPKLDLVGAFEGAGYRQWGYYRPSVDCIMFSRNDVGFCPVCKRAIEQTIDSYVK